MFRKTLRKVLKGTGWETVGLSNETFKDFLEEYGDIIPCRTLKKDVTYYELHKKASCGKKFLIYQEGEIFYNNFSKMSPFKNALCICYEAGGSSLAEIFEYQQTPFIDTILLHDLSFLTYHFEDFNIFKMDGSRVEDFQNLSRYEDLIAISKKTLLFEGPFQDGSEDNSFHIIIRYLTPNIYF